MRSRHVWKPGGKQQYPKIEYLTLWANFPNGAQWVKQEPIVHGLMWKLQQLQAEHIKDFNWRMNIHKLKTKGEMWWKDSHGIEYHFKIERMKRKDNWGVGQTKLGSARVETDAETKAWEEKMGVWSYDEAS